ncbi:MAG: glycosyltransferase [Candidatus Bathyarchaeia archaeon]
MVYEEPLVSIIIPTFNSGKTIELCLKSITEQTYKNIETIIVDNYSSDNTVEKAKQYNAKIIIRRLERSPARNLGAEEAKGEYLLFIDSDMELTPKVVEECVSNAINGFDALVIPEEPVSGKGFLSECRRIEKQLHHYSDALFELPRFFRKHVFQRIGGYDERLIFGEDVDLYLRIKNSGLKIGKIRSEIKHHEGNLSLRKISIKAYYYGKSIPMIIGKNPQLMIKRHNPVKLILQIKKLRINLPHLIGLMAIKFIEYTAYLIGFIIEACSKLNVVYN